MIATGGWTEADIKKERNAIPTLLSNKKYIKTFEVITQSQGIPGYSETRSYSNHSICLALVLWYHVR